MVSINIFDGELKSVTVAAQRRTFEQPTAGPIRTDVVTNQCYDI